MPRTSRTPGRKNAGQEIEFLRGYGSASLALTGNALANYIIGRTGSDVVYNVIVIVFTDLPADRAQGVFDDVLQQLAVPSYVEDGIVFGPFYEGHEGTAIYNSSFRPFRSPVPFLFVRHGVISDWKFFLDNEDWLNLWARRYGESAVQALAEELRRLPWHVGRD